MSASIGRILILPKGEYNEETEYEMLDLVSYNGLSWIGKYPGKFSGIEPSEENADYWQAFAKSAPIATTILNGLARPDGTTLEITEDGMLSVKLAEEITEDGAGLINSSILFEALKKLSEDITKALEDGNFLESETIAIEKNNTYNTFSFPISAEDTRYLVQIMATLEEEEPEIVLTLKKDDTLGVSIATGIDEPILGQPTPKFNQYILTISGTGIGTATLSVKNGIDFTYPVGIKVTKTNSDGTELLKNGTIEQIEGNQLKVKGSDKEGQVLVSDGNGNAEWQDTGKDTSINAFTCRMEETSKTSQGVTLNNNGDGTFTISGTSTSDHGFNIGKVKIKKGIRYKLVGCPKGGEGNYWLQTGVYDEIKDYGDGYEVLYDEDRSRDLTIKIKGGQEFNSVLFKPMLTTNLNATYEDENFMTYTGSTGALNKDVAEIRKMLYTALIVESWDEETATLNLKEYGYTG